MRLDMVCKGIWERNREMRDVKIRANDEIWRCSVLSFLISRLAFGLWPFNIWRENNCIRCHSEFNQGGREIWSGHFGHFTRINLFSHFQSETETFARLKPIKYHFKLIGFVVRRANNLRFKLKLYKLELFNLIAIKDRNSMSLMDGWIHLKVDFYWNWTASVRNSSWNSLQVIEFHKKNLIKFVAVEKFAHLEWMKAKLNFQRENNIRNPHVNQFIQGIWGGMHPLIVCGCPNAVHDVEIMCKKLAFIIRWPFRCVRTN